MSKLRTLCSLCFWLATGSTALAEADESLQQALFELDVVELAAEHNPGLKAALLELESARWEVSGLEAQYTPVLQLEANATQTSNPQLAPKVNLTGNPTTGSAGGSGNMRLPGTVSVNRVRRAETAAELRKHMLWGTDLSLRVAANYLETRYNRPVMGFSRGTLGGGYGVLAKLALKQPLWRGRGREVNEAELLAARLRRTSAEYARDRVASEVLRDALNAYWELWYATAAEGIEQQSRAVAVRQRDDAAARARTGSLAPADVLAFETQVATREESLSNAQLTRKQRELELLQKLGMVDLAPAGSLRADSEPSVSLPPADAAARRALAESAELRELASNHQLAALQQRTASNPQKPRLDLDAYIQAQGLGYRDVGAAAEQFAGMDALSGFVGLTYEAPINSRQERAAAARARIATDTAEQRLREGRQRVLANVGVLLERGRAGERSVVLGERTVEIARQQLAAEQARYTTGASTSLAVLEAEDRVRSAELRLARSRADLVESVLTLSHLTGELLQRHAQALK